MSVVDQAVEDRICQGGIADNLEPLIHRKLTGDDGGTPTLSIVEDFQQIASLCCRQD